LSAFRFSLKFWRVMYGEGFSQISQKLHVALQR
jgi:hypothetical protein